MNIAVLHSMNPDWREVMSLLITDCCRGLYTGVGLGQTPVRQSLIVVKGDPGWTKYFIAVHEPFESIMVQL